VRIEFESGRVWILSSSSRGSLSIKGSPTWPFNNSWRAGSEGGTELCSPAFGWFRSLLARAWRVPDVPDTPAKAGAGVFGISRPLCGDSVKPQRYQLN
jgi:hypothetical protein